MSTLKKIKKEIGVKKSVDAPQKERCVLCGALTPYDVNVPVNLRSGYICGAGQLCYHCLLENHENI